VQKYLGSVVPVGDNYFAALNSAVFSDGSFVFIPKGVACPMELSTYFRINNGETGQFERTLIVAEEGASVSYLEGCTAPMYDSNQLHAAVVELVASIMRILNIRRYKIGTLAMPMGREVFTISSLNGVCVKELILRFLGRRWKLVRQLLGSIPVVS